MEGERRPWKVSDVRGRREKGGRAHLHDVGPRALRLLVVDRRRRHAPLDGGNLGREIVQQPVAEGELVREARLAALARPLVTLVLQALPQAKERDDQRRRA